MNILLAIAISLLLLFNPGINAYAAESQTVTSDSDNPCLYSNIDTENPDYAGGNFTDPDELSGDTITVGYGVNKIAGCDVELRAYNGKLVGPTIRVHPGGKIHLKFINNLPPEDAEESSHVSEPQYDQHNEHECEYVEEAIIKNEPHNFNTTNFHTHGLHVDPTGCSDNALRVMRPRQNDGDPAPEYEIIVDIPKDHTSGTFWYHAHLHGSTALQVSSGMAGALIVEPDSPKPADNIKPEDIHTLEDIPAIAKAKEKIFMLQQIAYDDKGKIEDYGLIGKNPHPTINGQLVPVITMRPGEVQRWRFIHAGVAESINLEVRNRTQSREINLNEQIPLHEIAVDGIPLGKLDSWENEAIELEPGYRTDVLLKAPIVSSNETTQTYDLIDKPTTDKDSEKEPEKGHTLAKVIVKGTQNNMELPTDVQLAAARKADAPEDIDKGKIVGNPQKVVYGVLKADPNCTGDQCAVNFTVNNEPFDPRHKRTLHLGDVERWDLSVDPKSEYKLFKHPFHIHVNPFQYVRKAPDGEDETIWRDTLMVTKDQPYTVFTKYEDFEGKFVQHCHILDHEDQGMMELLEIVDKT